MMQEKPSRYDILLGLALVPFAAMYGGYVLSVMWRWFIVSTFAAPPLSVPAAIGTSLMVSMFVGSYSKEDDHGVVAKLLVHVIKITLYLFVGFIVKQFM